MAQAFLNRCIWSAASAGTGSFVVSAAAQNGYTPAGCLDPAAVDGATYHYFAFDNAGNHEEGDGVYTVATTTLTRALIRNSSNAAAVVSFPSAPTVIMGGPTSLDMPAIGHLLVGGTNKSVVYVDASGFFAQDNTAFNWDDSTKILQILGSNQVVLYGNGGTVTCLDGSSNTQVGMDVQNGFAVTTSRAYQFSSSSSNALSTKDLGLSRATTLVLNVNDGTGNNANGWMNWEGQARVTADVTFTSTTVLANITGLLVNLQAGRTYSFVAEISWTDAAAGGLQLAMSGTATATAIIYDGYIIDSAANGIKGNAQATALGTAVANAATTGTAGHARISGTITVNAAGTLTVQAAQFASNGTATTIKRGSYMLVHDMQ